MWKDNFPPIDRFQTKKNNYNYVRGQFTIYWQIPDKKIITIMWGAIYYLLTDSEKKRELQLCEWATYYLSADSSRKK